MTKFFFIMKGSAEIIHDGSCIYELQVGQTIGEVGLLVEGERPVTARARTFCMCAKMHRKTFLEVMKSEPETQAVILERISIPNSVDDEEGELVRMNSMPQSDDKVRQSILYRKLMEELDNKDGHKAEDALAHEKFHQAQREVNSMCSSLEKLRMQFDQAESRLGALETSLCRATGS